MSRHRSRARQRNQATGVAVERTRPELVPWRTQVEDMLQRLRTWSRQSYAQAIDAFLAQRFGDGLETTAEGDRHTAADDFVCAPGSAGDGSSILRVFADHATGLDAEGRDQVRRWEHERRRGVLVLQRARRDQLQLWDPLEGAPLTLHLLEKLPASRLQLLGRGTVVTATFQPWMARLVAVGVEFFGDPRALQLFREEVATSGAPWHEAPAPAPERTRPA